MSWARAIILVIRLISKLATYFHDRRTFRAGEAEAVSKALAEAQRRIDAARAARRFANDNGVSDDDPYLRD